MTLETLDGQMMAAMILTGAEHLKDRAKHIDALNVFPVPDGDTGTNMNLSMTSGVKEVEKVNSNDVSDVTEAFAKGLLMGARGNSGVILSQLFRGFSRGIGEKEAVNTVELAKAFEMGVETAYKAVMKPVEGTILTVAKDAANHAVNIAEVERDMIKFMEQVLEEAKRSLKRTPELLPVLKEVGVVDSGGQGLVTIYEGFLACLKGEKLTGSSLDEVEMEEMIHLEHHKIAQDFMDTSEIVYGYCTEFMVKFEEEKIAKFPFREEEFRSELSEHGDSLLVVSDEEVVKVHIHTEYPGNVLTLGQRYGHLTNIDIENMREQHRSIVDEQPEIEEKHEKSEYAIITVAMGKGIQELFESLGATVVIEGGQTMNPSTQDIANAIEEANAKQIIILPNNKNIIMAAEQAAELAEEAVRVVNSTSIPQGISAMLAFHPEATLEENYEQMTDMMATIKTGQVTYSVRDTKIDGMMIDKGSFMGILDGNIKVAHQDRLETLQHLISQMIDEDDEILTIIYGEDVEQDEVERVTRYIDENFEDVEYEIYDGKQPIYSYILSVE